MWTRFRALALAFWLPFIWAAMPCLGQGTEHHGGGHSEPAAPAALPANPAPTEHAAPAADGRRSPEDIWTDLMVGNRRFVEGKPAARELVELRRRLAQGQHPRAVILTCSDSRVGPEFIFDQNLGSLFVVRTAGNVADPVALGSIEYALLHLHVNLIVVLGHEKCGAVAAAAAGGELPTDSLRAIVRRISPALEPLRAKLTGDALAAAGIGPNVDRSAADLKANSTVIREMADTGRVKIIPAVYALESGEVTRRDVTARDTEATWRDLLEGNRRFVAGQLTPRAFPERRHELALGQHPRAIVLTCADSRVCPELIFDQGLGDIFVVRTAGNVVDPVALGSIEYAIEHLHADTLVVMGHEKCGAVAAAVEGGTPPTPNIEAMLKRITPSLSGLKAKHGASDLSMLGVAANVVRSARDIAAESAIVREHVERGKLTLITAVYQISTGGVVRLTEGETARGAADSAQKPKVAEARAEHAPAEAGEGH